MAEDNSKDKSDEIDDGAGGKDWVSSDWFGSYKPYENQWAYHFELGWIFLPNKQKGWNLAVERVTRMVVDKEGNLAIPMEERYWKLDLSPANQG